MSKTTIIFNINLL